MSENHNAKPKVTMTLSRTMIIIQVTKNIIIYVENLLIYPLILIIIGKYTDSFYDETKVQEQAVFL